MRLIRGRSRSSQSPSSAGASASGSTREPIGAKASAASASVVACVAVTQARTYRPWIEKHKPPHGYGSWCPEMPDGRAQALLAQAIPDPDPGSSSTKLYAVDREWCFIAQPTRLEIGEYHGYPVPGSEVPDRVLRELESVGRITRAERTRLRRQTKLPEAY